MSLSIVRQSLRISSLPRHLKTSHFNDASTFLRPAFRPQLLTRPLSYSCIRYNQISPSAKEEAMSKEVSKEAVSTEKSTEAVKQPTSRIARFIQNSKDLLKFYKEGIKLLWYNQKQAKALQLKIKNEGYELNRNEFQLIHRSKKDMLKLIPFGLVFCILPESIPLLVIYAPAMVPSTCLKENQIKKQREKIDKARQKMTMNVLKSAEQVQGIAPEDFLSLSKFQRIAKHYGYDFELSRIDRRHLSSYCRFMGLSDYGTQYILKHRLTKHMDYLKKDDELLLKEGLDDLNNQQLSHAVEERGMRSLEESDEQMKRALKYWLATSQANPSSQDIPSGLLVFSRMFLLNAKF